MEPSLIGSGSVFQPSPLDGLRLRVILPKPGPPQPDQTGVSIQISDQEVRRLARKYAEPAAYREFVNRTEQIEVWENEGGACG